jgi:hypothetical protein
MIAFDEGLFAPILQEITILLLLNVVVSGVI